MLFRSRISTFAAPLTQLYVFRPSVFRPSVLSICGAAALLLVPAALDQRRARAQQTPSAPEPAEQAPAPPQRPSAKAPASANAAQSSKINEDALRKQLEGKDLFLRGGYLDNTLTFNEHGVLIGHSPQGSYTLCAIRIDKVRLLKHKVELVGERYGLHFTNEMPDEDPTKAVDRVNITPRKKEVRITIDRELVVKSKQQKGKEKAPPAAKPVAAAAPAAAPTASAPAPAPTTTAPTPAPSGAAPSNDTSDAEQLQAEIAKAPEAERPADAKSVTTTTSPAHAGSLLEEALGNIFAQGFDTRMMAAMPGFWKLYYDAVAAQADYQPSDPSVLRQNTVDKKAQLKTVIDPGSNEFAQAHGVAGVSEYHVVVGADGKPAEIAVARPIGFGLDESAVAAIHKATFEPAVKDGKPVPVLLNMVVEFRIYSKRTAAESQPAPEKTPEAPSLPGPYSVQH